MIGTYTKQVANREEAVLPVLDRLGQYDPELKFDDKYRSSYFSINVNDTRVNLKINTLAQYLQAMSDGLNPRLISEDVKVSRSGVPDMRIHYTGRKLRKWVFKTLRIPYSNVDLWLSEPSPELVPEPSIPRAIEFESVEQTKQEIEKYKSELQRVREENRRIKADHERSVLEPIRRIFEDYERVILNLGYQRLE